MPSLLQLRKQIDRLDDRIVALLNQRLQLARKVGLIKARNGNKIYDPKREKEVLSRLLSTQKGPLNQSELCLIYQNILKISRKHQKQIAHTNFK